MNPRHELTTVPGEGDSLLRSVAGLPALYGMNDSAALYQQTASAAVVVEGAKPDEDKSIREKLGGIPDWNWGAALARATGIDSAIKRVLVGAAGIVVLGIGLFMVARD